MLWSIAKYTLSAVLTFQYNCDILPLDGVLHKPNGFWKLCDLSQGVSMECFVVEHGKIIQIVGYSIVVMLMAYIALWEIGRAHV